MTTLEHRTSLIDELLAEQSRLGTAVDRFSDWHETQDAEPAQARYYKNLIPLSKPLKGEQYAFEVNPRINARAAKPAWSPATRSMVWTKTKAGETWGCFWGDEYTSYQQTVTTACHHCADPACANGCPVLAYDKDKETGIVRHLDDQCIGCSYCMLKCPYDVPKFNKKRGIVRKCDMCQQRLNVGEAPACVQSCPNGAIAIRIVKMESMSSSSATRLLPGTMSSSYTKPSTTYVSAKPVPLTVLHADAERPRIEESHTPLALMLVLTQLATGVLLFARTPLECWIGFGAAVVGIQASVLHLGQPLKAWRCFLGWRKSWLSREILAFGGLSTCAAAGAALGFIPAWLAGIVGLGCVFCSVMVYVDTRRPFWVMSQTSPKFFGTVLVLGLSLAACFDADKIYFAAVAAMLKLAWEALVISLPEETLDRTKRLLLGPLRLVNLLRFVLGMLGIACLLQAPVLGFSLLLAGEFLERLCSSVRALPGRCRGMDDAVCSVPKNATHR